MTLALYWTCTPNLDVTKTTVIFLHAAWMSSTMFDETVDHLSRLLPGANLLCVDLNGHGKTTAGRQQFTLWDQGEDVVLLMDQLKIKTAVLAGISMGASIGLRIMLSHPSRVTALISIASTAEASSPEASAAIDQVRATWVSTPTPSKEIMDISIQAWGGDPDVNSPRAMRVKSHWVERHSGAENVDAILESVAHRDNILSRLHEIRVPVMLVHGEKDETWNLEGMLRIRDALANAKVDAFVVKDSGHLVIHMRDSEDVSQVIAEFISRVSLHDS